MMHARNLIIITIVSMVDGSFLDKLEAIARFIRRNPHPFGGIQLILCGKQFSYSCAELTRIQVTSISFLLFRIPSTERNCQLPLRSTRIHGRLVSLK
jgi:hypothetical protein